MAPKKKPAKAKDKKAAGKDAGGAAPPPDVEGASIEELNQKVVTLEREKNKEEEYRNYMQLERDKINAFWEISKKDLDDRRAELRNKDREVEAAEERHAVEVKVYKQKVKHLLFEHQNNIAALKADGELALRLAADEGRRREGALGREKRSLKREIKEQDAAHQELARALRLDAAKEGSKARQEFGLAARELGAKSARRAQLLREELELRHKHELHEVEERKNGHIHELMRQHEAAFGEVKNYYNDITANNLDLIKALKEDVAEMKKREAQNEKLMYEIAQENKRLSEPLARALREVDALRGQLAGAERARASLAAAKARLAAADKRAMALEWEGEVLTQRLAAAEAERDGLRSGFETGVLDAQRKSGLKSMLLEKRVEALAGALETRDAQLGEALAAARLEPSALAQVSGRLEDVLASKNGAIKSLQADLARASKAHNDLIRVYEAKLTEFGVPPEELGFRPLASSAGRGPAGLVAGR